MNNDVVIFTPSDRWKKQRRILRLEKMMNGFAKNSNQEKILNKMENTYSEALNDASENN